MADLDIQIKGGTVVDGTRVPRFQGDVWIKDGKIAQIGGFCHRFASFQWSGSIHRVGPFLLIFRVFCASHTPLVCESEPSPRSGLEGETPRNPLRLGPSERMETREQS